MSKLPLATCTKRALIVASALLMVLYVIDFLWLQHRVNHPTAGKAFDTVKFYWAATLKGGKVEIYYDQPQTETCVCSLFPHLGYRPCWYVGRMTVRVVR
jgi:hypothetical protein